MLTAERLLAILWERKWTFLLTALVTLGAAAAVTFSLPKVYKTTAYLYVSASGSNLSTFDQVQANQVVVKTLAELLQTRKVAKATADRLPYQISDEDLVNKVEVTAIEQSQLITLTASAPTPDEARITANTYGGTFVSLQQELLAESSASSRARLAASAPRITDPSRPRPRLYLLVGALVALLTGTAAAILRDRTDKRLRLDSSTELEGVPIIGQIPRLPQSGVAAALADGERTPAARRLNEAYRLVLANLAFANGGTRPRTLAVVSAGRGEGKSTTSLSLAIGAAELGIDVLLVDGDMRRPRVGTLAAGAQAPRPDAGLSSVLRDDGESLRVAVERVGARGLSVLRAGPTPPNPAALLASQRLPVVMRKAGKAYDLTIIDTPPLAVGADASLVASVSAGVILVIDSRSTTRTEVHRALDQLRRSRANLLGIVRNRADVVEDHGYYDADPASSAAATPVVAADAPVATGKRRA